MPERRQLGALLAVERTRECFDSEVFVIADAPKLETAAYFTKFNTNLKNRWWSLPAGGRDMLPDGSEETAQQTLSRELGEELSEAHEAVGTDTDLELVLQAASRLFANGCEVEQLAFPFIVAQFSQEKRVMNILAATSLRIQFDALAAEQQAVLEQAVWQRAGKFVPQFEIAQRVPGKNEKSPILSNTFRLPSISAVAFWMLHSMKDAVPATQRVAQQANGKTYQHALDIARKMKLQINNGAWNSDGSIAVEQLSQEDRKYLGV